MLGLLPISSSPISSVDNNNLDLTIYPFIIGEVWVMSCGLKTWVLTK